MWVRPARSGLPHLAIRDWYFGQKVHSTDAATRWSAISAGLDDLLGVANPQDWIYFAPEARTATQGLPGIPLDVFGCGALAYLILTGRPPADNLAQLEQKLTDTRALDPRAAVPGMPDGVADVIAKATSFAETDRPTSIVELLDLLRSAWDEVRRPEPDAERTTVDDPLEAQADDMVADRFIVVSPPRGGLQRTRPRRQGRRERRPRAGGHPQGRPRAPARTAGWPTRPPSCARSTTAGSCG